jgi:hypothetical protein
MPVFFYLTDDEAADVYLYLMLYPPTEQTPDSPLMAASLAMSSHSRQWPGSIPPTAASANLAAEDAESARDAEVERAAVSITATVVAFALVGGMVFTFREFKRLSTESAGHSANPQNLHVHPSTSGRTQTVYRTAPLFFGDANRSSQ